MNEIENDDFGVKEVIEAIGRINERYAKRIITSQSVYKEKAWSEKNPNSRGYEAETSKKYVAKFDRRPSGKRTGIDLPAAA